MSRIALVYCRENADLAQKLDQHLSRIGIPFDHITNAADEASDTFAQALAQNQEPAMLLLTDNLLKNAACMHHLLPALQQLGAHQKVFYVVADGVKNLENGLTERVPTQFDRMVFALQYMNYWQNLWLDLSAQQQHAGNESEKQSIAPTLDAARNIANQMGDFLNLIRETGYHRWEALEQNDYALFFELFSITEWHGQYQRLISASSTPSTISTATLAEPLVTEGLIAPAPVTESPQEPETLLPEMDHLLEELAAEEDFDIPVSGTLPAHDLPTTQEEHSYTDTDIQQTITDARLWIEKGHRDQGIELLQLALEQHPDNADLKAAIASVDVSQLPSKDLVPTPVIEPDTTQDIAGEARSYELMGDMAVEKGDYLFAKYCWDRCAEIMPDFPGIYKKLGIMVSEHLFDYRETATHYVEKALQQQPQDAGLLIWMAEQAFQKHGKAKAAGYYHQAIAADPSQKTQQRDDLYLPEPPAPTAIEPEKSPVAPQAAVPVTPVQNTQALTVLITGATSGIGRATAEIFAQNGHRLILTGRRSDRLSEIKSLFETKYQTEVLMLPFDVRHQAIVQNTLEQLPESWKNIDILVNNAGLAKGLSPIHEGELDHWETMIDTNIKGLLYVTRAIAPGMVARKKGHIINIGSSAGKEAYPNGNVYCATKFAVDALTKAMRFDLHTHNVRVSQVSPGHVEETEFALNRFDGDAQRAQIYQDFQPLKSSDIAEVIYFIATRPAHVNVQDIWLFATQQASATVIHRSGRE